MSHFLNQQELEKIQREKMNYFCRKLGINDYSRAERYLNQANWDEKEAVKIFINSHPEYNPLNNQNLNHNSNHNNNQNPQNIQYQIPPPTQNNDRNRPQIQNQDNDIVNDYLIFNISQSMMNNKYNKDSSSNYLNHIKTNLKHVQKNFGDFYKYLKHFKGIIIIYDEKTFNKFEKQIELIKKDNISKELIKKCVIYSALNISPIGNEFKKQFSCISYPVYFFCNYKDEKQLYITGKIEGAFDIDSFNELIYQNIPDSISNKYTLGELLAYDI